MVTPKLYQHDIHLLRQTKPLISMKTMLFALYGFAALYAGYLAITHTFVFFANQKLGYEESFRLPLIYLVLTIIFGGAAFLAYKLMSSSANVPSWTKIILYLPIGLIIFYALWAVLLVLSSGGKWN